LPQRIEHRGGWAHPGMAMMLDICLPALPRGGIMLF
jgi:hypothetical protein